MNGKKLFYFFLILILILFHSKNKLLANEKKKWDSLERLRFFIFAPFEFSIIIIKNNKTFAKNFEFLYYLIQKITTMRVSQRKKAFLSFELLYYNIKINLPFLF